MKPWSLSGLVAFTVAFTACSSSSPSGAAGSQGGAAGAGGASVSDGAAGSRDAAIQGGGTGTTEAPDTAVGKDGSGGQPNKDSAADAPSSSRADASAEGMQACQTFAQAFCAKLDSCAAFVTGVLYGDVATCEKRVALDCASSFQAPDTSATPAKTTACEQSLASVACADLVKGDLGPACTTKPGAVADNGPCAEDAQCATTFCARAPDAACGICQPLTKVGDPCVRGACSAGTVCPKMGTTMGTTCIAPVAGQRGATCTAQEQCDLAHAVGCNTTTKQCLPLTLSTGGGSCGANSIIPTSYAVCPASGTCSALLGGKCGAAAADGEACSASDTGKHCLPPARCLSGKCTIVDPTSCR